MTSLPSDMAPAIEAMAYQITGCSCSQCCIRVHSALLAFLTLPPTAKGIEAAAKEICTSEGLNFDTDWDGAARDRAQTEYRNLATAALTAERAEMRRALEDGE